MEWIRFRNNQVLDGEEFYISYNTHPWAGMGSFESDNGSSETALVIYKDQTKTKREFLILNGDFRKEYEEAFPLGLEECRKIFEAHKGEAESSWSGK